MAARRGFTLIELLVVVAILGILASIAIPKFAGTKEKAYTATMKGDLRNLATAQEGYAADNLGSFMPGGIASVGSPHAGYAPSTGVTVTVDPAAPTQWSATASHALAPGKICGMYIGNVPPGGSNPADVSGEPKCQ